MTREKKYEVKAMKVEWKIGRKTISFMGAVYILTVSELCIFLNKIKILKPHTIGLSRN